MGGDEMKAQRKSKHLVLDNAVKGMNGVVDHIDTILNKLKGNHAEMLIQEKTASPQPPEILPCFLDVLISSPDRIQKHCTEISEKLNELDDLLF